MKEGRKERKGGGKKESMKERKEGRKEGRREGGSEDVDIAGWSFLLTSERKEEQQR